jgi:hypothetical protein
MTREEWGILGCLFVIAGLLGWGFIETARHWNHAGRYEAVHVEGGYELQPVIMFNGQQGMTTTYVPAHDEKRWVCDHDRGTK